MMTSPNGASIPFMITRKQRLQLNGLGFSDKDIDSMKPSDALDIIRNNIEDDAPPPEPEPAPEPVAPKPVVAPTFVVSKAALVPQLPIEAQPDYELARNAAPWLDAFTNYSRKWAPDAYDGFHEAVGLWALSTAAGRRVAFPLGGVRFTSLYIALISRTSVFTKTTAAKVGAKVISAAGMNYLLCPDEMTPQAFIDHLSTISVPGNFDELSEHEQDWYKNAAAFAGQKGWYYDEFGNKVAGMMKEGGHMAEYRGILRVMDDGRDEYKYISIGRGVNKIKRPYLALMANMTPADLRKFAGRGAPLWNDGFWARFGLVSPGEEDRPKKGRWPNEVQTVPAALSKPLMDWHKRLGTPHVSIVTSSDEEGKLKKPSVSVTVADTEPTMMGMPTDVYDAFYVYRDALTDLVDAGHVEDLDGNYSRLPEKAIRIAALLASLHGEKDIKIRHWHRALEITERWRVDLHSLYRQLTGSVEVDRSRTIEDAIIEQIKRYGPRSARDLKLNTHMSAEDIKSVLPGMVADGTLLEFKEGKAVRYTLLEA